MLSVLDVKNLINYLSENFIICQYKNGDSTFIELLSKDDVFEGERDIKEFLK